jgi:hypothetical protein
MQMLLCQLEKAFDSSIDAFIQFPWGSPSFIAANLATCRAAATAPPKISGLSPVISLCTHRCVLGLAAACLLQLLYFLSAPLSPAAASAAATASPPPLLLLSCESG